MLTYVFDRLLPTNQEDGDMDCSAMSKVFLASVASCNHSQDAQMLLVNELKAALQRTLSLPEIANKYSHINTLANLVSVLIEACPGSQAQQKTPHFLKPMPTQSMNQVRGMPLCPGLS